MNKKSIMCAGLVTVDIIVEVDKFPKEDSDNKCQKLWQQRGGNASNNCTVLSILGVTPHFFGVIAIGNEQKFIEDDLKNYGVNISNAIFVQNKNCPTSFIINSLATGSRTILHNNQNLRELTLEDFCLLDLSQYKWIHIEGRNVTECKRMIEAVRKYNNKNENCKIKISVEIEKVRPQMEELIPLGDVVFISKDYARFRGWNSINEALDNLANIISNKAIAICPWGETGAGAVVNPERSLFLSPSFSPHQVVDTLGAGDTFIASTIFALAVDESVEKSITFGCKVAGFKVGVRGWSNFREKIREENFVQEIITKIS